jgi:gas vesicle protein GvpK/gas vesicle protein GvpA/GvpJ/GvpM family
MALATAPSDRALPAGGAHRAPGAAASLAEVLDRVLHLGVSLEGNLTIGVANVDLLYLDLRLLLGAVDTVWPEGRPSVPIAPKTGEAPPPQPPPLPDQTAWPSPGTSLGPSAVAGGAVAAWPPITPPGASPSTPAAGLIRLVLTLVKLLHDVLERQAVRRMDGGHLTAAQIEDVGAALLAQTVEIERLRQHFGLADRDVDLKFGLSDRSV